MGDVWSSPEKCEPMGLLTHLFLRDRTHRDSWLAGVCAIPAAHPTRTKWSNKNNRRRATKTGKDNTLIYHTHTPCHGKLTVNILLFILNARIPFPHNVVAAMDYVDTDSAREALTLMETRLDWDPLRERCQRRLGWSPDYARRILHHYQHYLALKVATEDWDGHILSPPLPVDAMWHEHLLDTKRYTCDCDRITRGRFLHHDADGDENAVARWERVQMTKYVHYTVFFENYPLSAEDRDLWEDFGNSTDDKYNHSDASTTTPGIPSEDGEDSIHSFSLPPPPPRRWAQTVLNDTSSNEALAVTPEPSLSESEHNDYELDSEEEGCSGNVRGGSAEDSSRKEPDDTVPYVEEPSPLVGSTIKNKRKRTILIINVKDRSGVLTFYQLKRTTKMSKVFQDYAQRRGLDLASLKFFISGEPIGGTDTPAQLHFVGDETIDCVPCTPKYLILVVQEESGVETFFKVKRSVRMFKIFEVMAQRIGVPDWKLTFFYNRIRIGRDDTADVLQMDDQDQIKCRVDLPGC